MASSSNYINMSETIIQKLTNSLTAQHITGVEYPYATTSQDNNCVEMELIDTNIISHIHTDLPFNKAYVVLLTKQMDVAFNLEHSKQSFNESAQTEYYWYFDNESNIPDVIMSVNNNGIHIQASVTRVSEQTLLKFLETQHTVENVTSTFKNIIDEMNRK